MPIYEYQCQACGHEMDALQKLSAEPLTDCPECGASALKKKISAAAFRLKGSGWYETDFKQDGRKNVHDSGEKSGDSASSGDKPKSDGKPAAKTETTATKPATKDSSSSTTSSSTPKSDRKVA